MTVLIVGAGPVGQLAALMLADHGIPVKLVDKRRTTLSAPKAHAVNPRTLEICESLGVSATHLRELGASANDGGEVRFVGTLTGPEFGVLPYERQDEAAFEHTPFPLSNIPQPVFEEELTKALGQREGIEFTRGVECLDLADDGSVVMAELQESDTGNTTSEAFDYVIAADGAGSGVRQSLDIPMQGPEALQDYLMIHFSADLTPLTEGRRGVLYFLFEPGVNGVLIAYDQAKTWVLMQPWNPAEESLEDYDDARCHELIAAAVGQAVPEAVIENLSPWSMSAQIAETYRRGRIFLAGDAAHRFPPAGGLGLNTGAGDVQNLTWKLAAVLRGEAGEALLDTYEAERQPVAITNSEQSLNNAAKLFDLIIAIHGVEPEKTAERYARVSADPSACPELGEAVAAQRPHFDSFALQLGYRYNSPAISEPAPLPDIVDVADYQPSWAPGAHHPHLWVTAGGETRPLQSFFPANCFSLLCGPDQELKVDGITCVRFGHDFQCEQGWDQTGMAGNAALLLRPDGHIAARLDHPTELAVQSVLSSILAA